MGVLGLWTILEQADNRSNENDEEEKQNDSPSPPPPSPTISLTLDQQCTNKSFSSAPTPRILAVDLSVWLMEALSVARTFDKATSPSSGSGSGGGAFIGPNKYHLQYIFQRACAFMRQSIRLIFVTDGRPPKIKARLTEKANQVSTAVDGHRRQNPAFTAQIRDATKLLELMDLPVLTLQRGEAEALCAALNAHGFVDGVLTPDSDCFLFGGQTILRNLEATQMNLAAKIVSMDSIKQQLGLDRIELILLALMLGSDYTSGVRGLGPHKAIKFMRVLQDCLARFESTERSTSPPPTAAVSSLQHRPNHDHAIIRLFRSLIQADTPEAGIQLICKYHSSIQNLRSSSHAASSIIPAASPSSRQSIDYTQLTLAELKCEMSKYGLKSQSKAQMILRLQHIQSVSPQTASAIVAASSPSELSSPSIVASNMVLLSDSDDDVDDDDELDVTSSKSKLKSKSKPKKKKQSSAQISLQSFLQTYFTKIHARYHEAANRNEMENIINSYLEPILQPSVAELEEQIKDRIPNPTNFLGLRSFCSTEMRMPFVKFEKAWLPILLHLQLWKQVEMNQVREEEGSFTPPTRSSSTSTVPLSGSSTRQFCSTTARTTSSSSLTLAAAAATVISSQPLYELSHISKRRIIQGVPSFVLFWTKTERGRKEIASLPKDANEAARNNEGGTNEDANEIDLTQSPSLSHPSPTIGPLSSPVIGGVKKKSTNSIPIQDVDMNLYETYEPVSFLKVSQPALVAKYEADEQAELNQKEQAKLDKIAATKASKKSRSAPGGLVSQSDILNQMNKPGRKKKNELPPALTPPITSFFRSPPITAATAAEIGPSPPPTSVSTRDSVDLLTPSPEPPLNDALRPISTNLVRPSMFNQPLVNPKSTKLPPKNNSHLNPSSRQVTLHEFAKSKKITQVEQVEPSPDSAKSNEEMLDPSKTPSHSISLPVKRSTDEKSLESASIFSSKNLSTCPLCSRSFSRHMIDSHVNTCLDQQQLLADEQLARGISAKSSPPKPSCKTHSQPILPPPDTNHDEGDHDDDDNYDLDSEVQQELILVPDDEMEPPPLHPSAAVAAAAATSLTPKKRKSAHHSSPLLEHSPKAKIGERVLVSRPTAAVATYIEHEVEVAVLSDGEEGEDDDQPGSTIYQKRIVKLPAPRVVRSIFSQP